MNWEPIDFQGIATLESGIVPKFTSYLEEREKLLVQAFYKLFSHQDEQQQQPSSPAAPRPLAEAYEGLVKLLREKRRGELSRALLTQIELLLTEHVELLSGSVKELFYLVDAMPIEKRGRPTLDVVKALCSSLESHIEALLSLIWRLDQQLNESVGKANKSIWRHFQARWQGSHQINRTLILSLRASLRYLKTNYRLAASSLAAYSALHEKAEYATADLGNYRILHSLEEESQSCVRSLFLLLKMWEINKSTKLLPQHDIERALRLTFSPIEVESALKGYTRGLKQALFEWARAFKREGSTFFTHLLGRTQIKEQLSLYHEELQTLKKMTGLYRQFLYSIHPGGERKLWGLLLWRAAAEPLVAKRLESLVNEVIFCDNLYEQMNASLAKEAPQPRGAAIRLVEGEVGRILREIGQPLASRAIQKQGIDELLVLIQQMDELGSFDQKAVDYIDNLFNTMLRLDWKYHLLSENSLFQELYEVHQQLAMPSLEPTHLRRKHHFFQITAEIVRWLADGDEHNHAQQIESHLSELRGDLQNFLAKVQRQVKHAIDGAEGDSPEVVISNTFRQLLDYRYLFANFFARLQREEGKDPTFRQQLLFIDQYFDTVEGQLEQMRKALNSRV